MVVHFLTLGRSGTEEGSAGINQVFALLVQLLGNQEVFLLRANGGADTLHIGVPEQLQNPHGLTVQGLHGTKQRGFLVQCLTAVGTEGSGNAKCGSFDKGVGSGIPGGVAPGFEGGPQTAGGEGGGVGFALNQFLSGEIHDDTAVWGRGDKAVMLFGGNPGEGLEPVGIVGCAVGDRPVLHSSSNGIGHAGLQLCAMIDGFSQGLVYAGAQIRLHNPVVKYQTAKIIGYATHNRHSFG